MSSVNTYKVLINRLEAFANGHFQLRRFTTGQVDIADLEKEGEYPWMCVVPTDISYSPGVVNYSFDVIFADLPRDKSDKTEYQVQSINDMELIARDLIAEIRRGTTLFGSDITLEGDTASTVPFMEEYKHVLTGVTLSFTLQAPFSWNPCDVPADYAITRNTGPTGIGFDAREVRYYTDLETFPETGIDGVLYGAFTENLLYYWNGSAYVAWGGGGGGGGLTLGETSSTAYRGDRGKIAFDHSQEEGNPHNTTAAEVGADPSGTAAGLVAAEAATRSAADTSIQNELDAEELARATGDTAITGSLNTHISDTGNPHSVTKTQVGLGNVPNTDTTNASNISSGTLPVARLNASDVLTALGFDTAYTDFSGVTGVNAQGFSSFTDHSARYRQIGKQVDLDVRIIGASASTTFTITLPVAVNASMTNKRFAVTISNNSTQAIGVLTISGTTGTVTTATITSIAATGNKNIIASIQYESV